MIKAMLLSLALFILIAMLVWLSIHRVRGPLFIHYHSLSICYVSCCTLIWLGVFLWSGWNCPAWYSGGRRPLIAGCLSLHRLGIDSPVRRYECEPPSEPIQFPTDYFCEPPRNRPGSEVRIRTAVPSPIQNNLSILSLYLHVYIYIYIYIGRERERVWINGMTLMQTTGR